MILTLYANIVFKYTLCISNVGRTMCSNSIHIYHIWRNWTFVNHCITMLIFSMLCICLFILHLFVSQYIEHNYARCILFYKIVDIFHIFLIYYLCCSWRVSSLKYNFWNPSFYCYFCFILIKNMMQHQTGIRN